MMATGGRDERTQRGPSGSIPPCSSSSLCTTAQLRAPRASLTSVTAVSGSPAVSAADVRGWLRSGWMLTWRADEEAASGRHVTWAAAQAGLPFPPLSSPARPSPCPPCPPCLLLLRLRALPPAAPAAPAALRGPQAGDAAALSSPPPPPLQVPRRPLGGRQNFRG